MHTLLEQLGLLGIVPVIAIEQAHHADPLAAALLEGGLPCAEVTLRTQAAPEAIRTIAGRHPSMLLGAGTVLSVEQVKMAVDAGAQFIVSPGLNRKVVEYCLREGIPVTPGVATPGEVETALDLGLEVVKFFPAEAAGGIEYLKALAGPYTTVKFIPTGGIDATNLLVYLRFPRTLACGGSWMVKADLITNGKFDEIRKLTSDAVAVMLGFSLKHVGINCETPEESARNASTLSGLLGLPTKEGTSSTFVGTEFELTKKRFPGTHGHLAIGTNFIHRAIAYLERNGVGMRQETRVEKNGKLAAVYLDREVAGFALHLLQL